jgi:cation transport ATPase
MEHEQVEKQVAQKSALIYIPISLGLALLFFLASTFTGNYPIVARLGGTVWVALLSLIVSMPMVISRVKKRQQIPT